MEALRKPIILILCTGNSCRSHMAEGILREVAGDMLEVQSAGSDPAGYVHPLAIRAPERDWYRYFHPHLKALKTIHES